MPENGELRFNSPKIGFFPARAPWQMPRWQRGGRVVPMPSGSGCAEVAFWDGAEEGERFWGWDGDIFPPLRVSGGSNREYRNGRVGRGTGGGEAGAGGSAGSRRRQLVGMGLLRPGGFAGGGFAVASPGSWRRERQTSPLQMFADVCRCAAGPGGGTGHQRALAAVSAWAQLGKKPDGWLSLDPSPGRSQHGGQVQLGVTGACGGVSPGGDACPG